MKKNNDSKMNTTNIVVIVCLAVAVIGLIIALIVQVNKKNDYVINYHVDDKTTEGVVENNKTDTSKPSTEAVVDDATNTVDNSNYISIERALEVALENVGAGKQDVRDIDVELDYKAGQTVYEVTFDYNGYEYEYYLNPTSGEIIKSFKEVDR